MESYLTRWDACLTPPESLMATTSRLEDARPCQQRRKLRPADHRGGWIGQRPAVSRVKRSISEKKPPPLRARSRQLRSGMEIRLGGRGDGDAPMRPKPLMATLTLASVTVLTAAACGMRGRWGQRSFATGVEGRRARVPWRGGNEIFAAGRWIKLGGARTLTALPRLRPAV